jgi:hypothetical protein
MGLVRRVSYYTSERFGHLFHVFNIDKFRFKMPPKQKGKKSTKNKDSRSFLNLEHASATNIPNKQSVTVKQEPDEMEVEQSFEGALDKNMKEEPVDDQIVAAGSKKKRLE